MGLHITKCPSCGKAISPAIQSAKPDSKWWRFSSSALLCPECGVRLRIIYDKNVRWFYAGGLLMLLSELIEWYFQHHHSADNPGAIALGFAGCACFVVGILTRRYVVDDRQQI